MGVYKAVLGNPSTGQDVTNYLEWDSWSVDATFGMRGQTAKFYLAEDISLNPTNWNVLPKPLQQLTVTDTVLGKAIFAGVVTDPRLNKEGPLKNRWDLACRDYTLYAENRFVSGDYTNKTGDFIIKDLVARTTGCGLTTNHVPPMPQIARVVINYKSLADAIKLVCDYASQGALWGWSIDSALDVHTFNALTQPTLVAPVFTDSLAAIDEVTNFGYVWDNFSYEWDGTSVRNRVKVRGGNYTGQQTDRFVGNAASTSFPLTYPINSSNANASVSVGGSGLTVTIDTSGGTVPAGQAYLTQAPSGAWFLRLGTTPANGAAIVATYNYVAPVLTQVDDVPSQLAYPGPNGGIYEMYLSDPTISDLITAKARGQREISEYGVAEERLYFTSKESNGFHLNAGDVFSWHSGLIPDFNQAGPPIGITGHYAVAQLHIEAVKGGYRKYTITGARVS